MDLDEAVDELYALPPDEFVQRRDQLARQASSDGDRPLGAAIKKLRRPTVAAALLNALARAEPEPLESYLTIGEQLRQAQADLAGDRMRELSRRRQVAASELVELAVQGGEVDAGAQVRRELDETLRAAVADPQAARVIASGCLTRALAYAGFGEVDITAATATPLTSRGPAVRHPARRPAAEPPTEPDEDPEAPLASVTEIHPERTAAPDPAAEAAARAREVLAEQRAAARARVEQAEEAAEQAGTAAVAAAEQVEATQREHTEAVELVAELQERLTRARKDVRETQRAAEAAKGEARTTQHAAGVAEKVVERARRHARSLSGD